MKKDDEDILVESIVNETTDTIRKRTHKVNEEQYDYLKI